MVRRSNTPKPPDWPPTKVLPQLKEQLRQLQEFKGRRYAEVDAEENQWELFTRSVIIHGFGEESQNLRNHLHARSAGIHNMMGISEQQRQLNFQQRISEYEAMLNSSIREMEVSLPMETPDKPNRMAAAPAGRVRSVGPSRPTELAILISHSSKDVELAKALVSFLRAGLLTNSIRCSSVDGYRLPAGVHSETQLRDEVNNTGVLIGLITPSSLASAYVMFELGARWGAGSFMIPLLGGVTADEIRGPLSALNALDCNNEAQLHQLLADTAQVLGLQVQSPATYNEQLKALKTQSAEIEPGANRAAPVAVKKMPFRVTLTVTGNPPSPQLLQVDATETVTLVRLEYLLSNEACLAADNLNLKGQQSYQIPIEDTQILKLWNTHRADRNPNDHSGPAKLRLSLITDEGELAFTLPVQMDSYTAHNTYYRKLFGAGTFRSNAR